MNDTMLPFQKENSAIDAMKQFNESHDVTVEIAVIFGSHIRGTSTRRSDIVIRAVHVQDDPVEYIKHSDTGDSITEHYEKDIEPIYIDDNKMDSVSIEIESWDITKFTELLLDSNDQAVEVIQAEGALIDHPCREELRSHIIEENNVNLRSLYNSYVAHAEHIYQTYLSDHLVSNADIVYPIKEKTNDGYIVIPPSDAEEELYIPEYAVDLHENRKVKEPISIPYSITAIDDEKKGNVERYFRTTMTEQTIKRNVTVIELCLKARFIANMKSIPSVNVRKITSNGKTEGLNEILELENDDFNIDASIDKINSLFNETSNKNKIVGDIVKSENILPPRKETDLPTGTPEMNMINKTIEKIVTQT